MKTKLEAFVCGLLAALLVFIVGAPAPKPAHAANGESANVSITAAPGYKLDRQTALWRTGVTTGDTLVLNDTRLALVNAGWPEFETGGRQTIEVSPRFTQAGANCVLRWVAVAMDPPTGKGVVTRFLCGISAPITFTASAATDSTGKYIAPTFPFDTYGASHGRLLVISVSAGTVDFAVGSN